ncbi:trihelix transcription factor GTL1-like [Centruroides sculpturatus]|uniref:trihelix transcription factor GTL1-like n=1 Tax=Centruroides sculpturatus TaxID=218467 RepID=UPI000C6ED097|nr:trihelix transcription factor GTL1-like [Centruroides sculpturatus]XP_023223044.1 trihelix transcription factor GTL1-like [Centruroides sculpturatus]
MLVESIKNLQNNTYSVSSTSGIWSEVRPLSDDLLMSNGKWTDAMTRLLISIRLEMEEEFQKSIAKNKLWVKVSDHLAKEGYTISGTECNKKWQNLLSTYRRNKEKVKSKTGKGAITWPYFDLFNAVIGCKSDVTSPETSISSLPEKN